MRLPIWFKVERDEIKIFIDLDEESKRRSVALGQICYALGHLLPVDVDIFIVTERPGEASDLLSLNRYEETSGELGRRTRTWASTLKTVVREVYRLRGIRNWEVSLEETLDNLLENLQLGGEEQT